MPKTAAQRKPPMFEQTTDYVQSLVRGLNVIRAFDHLHRHLTLSQCAERTGLSRAAARRFLLTLAHAGYVSQSGRQFQLTARVLELGYAYISSLDVSELCLPLMRELAQTLNESCSLAVLNGHEIVYILRVPVRKFIALSLHVGARLPAYCTSLGRVLLSGLDKDAIERALKAGERRKLTAHTVVALPALLKEIARVRTDGYAVVAQELELGLLSLAVPVRNRDGRIVAALNIGMPWRADASRELIPRALPQMRRTAQAIERITAQHWEGL